MKIGFYVQGTADKAFVEGLCERWCRAAETERPVFRGNSKESLLRELRKSLLALDEKGCDFFIVLTDADGNSWKTVKKRESVKIPEPLRDRTVFGVADRNIESWLSLDRQSLSKALNCKVQEIPIDDPSSFIDRRFGLTLRDQDRSEAEARVRRFVAQTSLRTWIKESDSFRSFYQDVRALSQRNECAIPDELDR